MKLEVVYEDKDMLICRKPAGLAVQSASIGRKDLESLVRTYLFEKSGQTNPYLGIIHRLDQPVQGLVVFAKNQKSAADLSRQVQDGRMKKHYLAIVEGDPKPEETLTHYLKKEPRGNLSAAVSEKTPGAKKATLTYRWKKSDSSGKSLVEIELFTGRHHQIRVQMAAAKLPLVGDVKYRPREDALLQSGSTGEGAKHFNREQLALCAYRLELQQPRNGRKLVVTSRPEGSLWDGFSEYLSEL
ncbi:MAG: RluA family pseudouridine synthase [Eubacteriales bacterium]|nr:RluA family pseudouridine synthase [Eubacteriales bacterium]